MKKLTINLILIASIVNFSGCGSSGGNPDTGGNTDTIQFTLNWDEPVVRENTTPLIAGDITYYRIYYGTSPSILNDYLQIDASVYSTSFSGEIAIPDSSITYYFAMTAVDQDNVESRKSDVLSY